ncbi:MAG: hypothetical protein HYX25_08345 [Candidatus Solibacter usitatus]|nr:hypothetical protein [Candidatus Solibacter usitatus]
MSETLEKLRPDRDLQCYFERPSGVAALSSASATGFTVSGCWRQQFDWAVIEWNRDNVFEHPLFRNLPDGDLSGVVLTYDETRQNCISLDSTLFPTVDWPSLRIWVEGTASPYKVPLHTAERATAIAGSYQCASAVFELQGTVTTDDYVELAWSGEHYTYLMRDGDILENAVEAIVEAVNASTTSVMKAARDGRQITLTYTGVGQTIANSTTGSNGNRVGVYGNVSGAQSESWLPAWQMLSGGTSPSAWRVTLDFSSLQDETEAAVPTTAVRKMRWTYAADLQAASYQRGEFEVQISNWTVAGSNLAYQVAGPGSRRIEDDTAGVAYSDGWTPSTGAQNFSGGSIHVTTTPGAVVTCAYLAGQSHLLYLGTRKAPSGATISVSVDGGTPQTIDLALEDDVLVRILLGPLSSGAHTVAMTHAGVTTPASYFYFDFLELAVATATLPVVAQDAEMTLATDWDTDHSIALAPERTAWILWSLGFAGRVNHYVGALWFYELNAVGFSYASATVEFTGTPTPSAITTLYIGESGSPDPPTAIAHLNLAGDTAGSIAKAFELELNSGYTAVWAQASGSVLTIYARAIGAAGESITLAADPPSGAFAAVASSDSLANGNEGDWRTDLTATPRLNRAARDWSRSFFTALQSYGITATAALSMELQHGDPSTTAGIAQRYPSGAEVALNTPALQTNFSPASLAFWQQAYLDLATLMSDAGQSPYLQFGEVQWWYFPGDNSGMPYYDEYTTATFTATYGRAMHVFTDSSADPASYPDEALFLPSLIAAFTNDIMTFVRQTFSSAVFEVLYPPDVNNTPLNGAVNFAANWTPSNLACLKTENFSFTGSRDLNLARGSISLPMQLGFPRTQSSHLVGIGDYTTPWRKEARLAKGEGLESVVLFALDQFCLIGYAVPLPPGSRSSRYMG